MVDECSNLEDSLFLQSFNIQPTKTSPNIGVNLTSLSLAGCQCITSTFVRRLTQLTQSNLKSINISYTEVDCTALVYLAGYTLSTAVQMANLSDLDGTVLKDVEVNKELNKLLNQVDSDTPKASSQVCAYCNKDEAQSNKTISTVDSFNEYDIIKGLCKHNIYDYNDEWDVVSLEEVEIEVSMNSECTCGIQPAVLSNREPEEDDGTLKQLFQPKLVCLDITSINFYDDDLGKRCLELFLQSNQCLQQFYASWSKLDNEMLETIAKNEIDLRSLSLVSVIFKMTI